MKEQNVLQQRNIPQMGDETSRPSTNKFGLPTEEDQRLKITQASAKSTSEARNLDLFLNKNQRNPIPMAEVI